MNAHYGKLTQDAAAKLNAQMPGVLIAGKFRATAVTELSLKHMRQYAQESGEKKTAGCFVCTREEIQCPEDSRVDCLCGRSFFKYYDVTDYSSFVERGRWNLFWIRLNFKMSAFLKRRPSS